ncbi:MAG: hypothetical protein F6K50_31810 [Moorea sp. SIO3I7]|uniref:hypothetical protein n=1 Tax=unclassified Moorena TaxID=2683338 RepID=UPI0013BFEDA8|nr:MULTISPECIES: hypothetical protein [unclassified Moorena]NEN99898.1 hypothetical protein [Moorena sp. SIO3I7]NEO07876.1 hypothetical protein [Moorena sp. SIO3I8]NEP25190.1 hypothetical protein [Moorena sp. SIO3I6]
MATLREQPPTLAFGHATRTTSNLGLWPRYANNLQPWPLATLREQPSTLAFGHATRTTFNPTTLSLPQHITNTTHCLD